MQALQKKQKTWVLLLLGALLGLAAFLCLYGTAPLDPANDAWIWYGYDETDIHQHYAGWLGFRNSSWQFPLAQADALTREGLLEGQEAVKQAAEAILSGSEESKALLADAGNPNRYESYHPERHEAVMQVLDDLL